MGTLFENIVRELILELSSDDAYTRFYSSLDKQVYDALMNGVPNITPFHTLVLNCFVKCQDKDKYSLSTTANKINSIWKNLDTNQRRELTNLAKQSKGKITTIDGVIQMIKQISESDEMKSQKNVASDGYVVVYENDKVLVTCTTTYMANHHYFGHTKWCTASDLSGENSGYDMFLDYVILGDFDYDGDINYNKSPEYCLIQLKFKDPSVAGVNINTNSSLYQVCCGESGRFWSCCDEFDKPCFIKYLMSDECTQNVKPQIQNLIYETKKMAPIERSYIKKIVQKKSKLLLGKIPKLPSNEEFIRHDIHKMLENKEYEPNSCFNISGYEVGKFIRFSLSIDTNNLLSESDVQFLENTEWIYKNKYKTRLLRNYIINKEKNEVYNADYSFDGVDEINNIGSLFFGINSNRKFIVLNANNGKYDKYNLGYFLSGQRFMNIAIFSHPIYTNYRYHYLIYNYKSGEFLFDCNLIDKNYAERCVRFFKQGNIVAQKSFYELGLD